LIFNGEHGTYWSDGEICTCYGFWYRKTCKHVEAAKKMKSIEEIAKSGKELQSSIKGLNEMFGGSFYSSDVLCGIFGKPNMGKTLLLVQDAFYLASEGKNVLLIDTEGGTWKMMQAWKEVFEKRFGKLTGNLYIEKRRGLSDVMEYVGYRGGVTFKSAAKDEKGIMEFRVVQTLDEAQIEEDVEKAEIDLLIMDSISEPIRSAIPLQQQNNPAKASALALILGRLVELQKEYNLAAIVSSHASFNPSAYELSIDAEIFGGLVLKHNCKRVVYLDRREAAGFENYRRLWQLRGEDEAEMSNFLYLKYSDAGISEVPKNSYKIEDVLTSGEVTRLKPLLTGERK
jgi:predicted ATP-dependent serine protease